MGSKNFKLQQVTNFVSPVGTSLVYFPHLIFHSQKQPLIVPTTPPFDFFCKAHCFYANLGMKNVIGGRDGHKRKKRSSFFFTSKKCARFFAAVVDALDKC
jgi:hypothetical protein